MIDLNRTGLVSVSALRSSRKFVILGIFIVAAMATPPDVVSQVTLALPLFLLYELGIILCVMINRQANAHTDTDTDSSQPEQYTLQLPKNLFIEL